MNILNLTRKLIPELSVIRAENIHAINNIPENVLTKMMQNGNKTIAKVGMNESKGVRILENGINTTFTDGLCGCNGVSCVAKGLDGNPINILSHYTPLEISRINNAQALTKQLETYDYFIDKTVKPKVFYNIPGQEVNGKLVANDNPLLSQLRTVFDKFFKKGGYEEEIISYESKNRTPFDSRAMISQFAKENEKWKLKLTTVGEQEHKYNLWV